MIRVELVKLLRRPRTWVTIGMLCALPVVVAAFVSARHLAPPPGRGPAFLSAVGGQVAVPGVRGRTDRLHGYVDRAGQPGGVGRYHRLVVLGPHRQPRQPLRQRCAVEFGEQSAARGELLARGRTGIGRQRGTGRGEPGTVQRGAERDDPARDVHAAVAPHPQQGHHTPGRVPDHVDGRRTVRQCPVHRGVQRVRLLGEVTRTVAGQTDDGGGPAGRADPPGEDDQRRLASAVPGDEQDRTGARLGRIAGVRRGPQGARAYRRRRHDEHDKQPRTGQHEPPAGCEPADRRHAASVPRRRPLLRASTTATILVCDCQEVYRVLVVHGLWLAAGRLALWGEESTLPARPARRRGRPPREPQHPFAASHEALIAALGDAATKAMTGTVVLSLPTSGASPAASPELIRDDPADGATGTVTMRAWLVPTLEYEPDDALLVLRAIGGTGVTGGATLRHLVAVTEFADDLVTRGRLLPTVQDGPAAIWRPVLSGADAAWAQALALGLPPAGRAEAATGAGGAGGREAAADITGQDGAAVLASALDALVDAAARAALDGYPIGRDRPRTAADAWLRSLIGRERRFDADPAAVTRLSRDLAGWQREAAGGPVRACFRLVEPGADETSWQLRFALQATDQPSLVVDAERVWRSRGTLKALARHIESPQETLLAELGRASRLHPPIRDALRTARPSTLDMGADGAHAFLVEGAPMLAAAGFGVLLPSWWGRPSARLGARLRAHSPTAPGTVAGTSALGEAAIVEYRWELALGDAPLSEEELAELTALKTPLVRLRGQWVEVDPRRLANGVKLLRSNGHGQAGVAELLRMAITAEEAPGGLPVTGVSADGWLGDLLSGQADRYVTPVAAPDGFRGTLRPYQQRGLAWLTFLQSLGLGGILADDMGLGKTVQLLALMAGPKTGPKTGPTLLVCPMSLVGNWQREAAKFAPGMRVHVHHGAERPRGRQFTAAVRDADLVVTTYALAARDADALGKIDWHRLVADEAQAIKNAATRQAAAIRSLPARHRIAVTGTPVENRLADLWSLMEFANPGLLGSAAGFKKRYAEPVERHGDEEAAARLRRLTGPFILRRVKTDRAVITDLPEKLEMEVVCNLTAEQASLYQAVIDDMLARIESSEGIERRGLVLATMTKLKQVCNHPAQFLHDATRLAGRSGKLARLEEILDEVLAAGEKALLFTQYASFGELLRGHLSARFSREVAFLHGGVPKATRDDLVTRFQGADGPPLFVLSLKAGGTGLTLTAANHVVHVDRWWNPAVEDQATDRAFRIGQKRAVQVRKFVCAGTVEEKISAMIRDKRGLAARIVGTGEDWLTSLSTSELRDLFALEEGAVVE